MTERDWDYLLDELDQRDEFVCSKCCREKPRAGSVTMRGEDTLTEYRYCADCVAEAYRAIYGDTGLAPYAAEGR